ncbi:type II secretion system protein [Pseudomonas oryzae]|uniref:MSHA pilin protein MshD n=1 Tax=Pseudomonas oryzae TaxID=1392877 RepID=A0A1H1WJJ6_9PSED|nr:type II secretion system protein [Pseudomonas oryzae]SDS96496.1 MSHA pilin protein MshD [Pseudomonas oryzae]
MIRRQRGVTLVELVIAIVIVGIAAAALYGAMASIGGRSADPLLRQQSLALAEAYLEEVLLQDFLDPATATQCPAAQAQRHNYDNVCDYAGLVDNGARNAYGEALAGLGGYRVSVSVTPTAWNGLAASDVLYVQVSVRDPANQELRLGGYRVRHD